MKEQTSYLLYELLKLSSIKIDKKELEFQFESHPSYPSLHSITGVLNHFGIDNLAIEVPNNKETLEELPEFFIAHLKDKEGEHFVIVKRKDNQVEIILDKKSKKILSTDSFLQSWTGIIVAVEKTESFDKNSQKQFSGKIFYYLGALVGLIIFFYSSTTLFQTFHFLIAIVGVVISVLIVQHELGLNSTVLDKFCSGNNEKTSCDDVLKSKGATIIGNFKFSDVGLIYFSALLLSWLILSFI